MGLYIAPVVIMALAAVHLVQPFCWVHMAGRAVHVLHRRLQPLPLISLHQKVGSASQ